MNVYSITMRDLAGTLRKLTAEPLSADFFEWCRDTRTFRHVEWSLSAYGLRFDPTESLSDLKARLQRWLVRDALRRDKKHWSFDPVRRAGVNDILRTIEQYQETVQ